MSINQSLLKCHFPLSSSFPVAVAEVCVAHAQQSPGVLVLLVAGAHDVTAVVSVAVQVVKV